MIDADADRPSITLHLGSPEDTAALAIWLAPALSAGDTILLDGPIGAGKSHFARSLIQQLMAKSGSIEEVPSPTYTLAQVYEVPGLEIWHVDLYRLAGKEEAVELGLEDAFAQAACLIEWPDRLGDLAPRDALELRIEQGAGLTDRTASLSASSPRWIPILKAAAEGAWQPHD